MALEQDREIFDALLSGMMVVKGVSKGKRKAIEVSSGSDSDSDDEPPVKVTRRHRECK